MCGESLIVILVTLFFCLANSNPTLIDWNGWKWGGTRQPGQQVPLSNKDLIPPGINAQPIDIPPIFDKLTRLMYSEVLDPKYPGERISYRPDGLPPVTLLLAQEYSSDGKWDVKQQRLYLSEDFKSLLKYELGDAAYRRFEKEMSKSIGIYWRSIIKSRLDEYTKFYLQSFQVKLVVRSDLACPMTQKEATEELFTDRQMRVVFLKFTPDIRNYRFAGKGWTPVAIHGSTPLPKEAYMTSNQVDWLSIRLRALWESPFKLTQPFNRASQVGPPEQPLPAVHYEHRRLDFGSDCAQSKIFAYPESRNTALHCVILPVALNRLVTEERAVIACNQKYPRGTKVIYLERYLDAHDQPVKAFTLRVCDNAWGAPKVLKTSEGQTEMKNCLTSRSLLSSLY